MCSRDGLFGIHDLPSDSAVKQPSDMAAGEGDTDQDLWKTKYIKYPVRRPPESPAEGLLRIREKRWQVFVARAAARFETWWRTCVPQTFEGAPASDLICQTMYSGKGASKGRGVDRWPALATPIKQLSLVEHLPPLGE